MKNDTNPLHLEKDDWEILCSILHQYNAQFYAYGSRIKNTHKKFSDVDLCYEGNLDLWKLGRLITDLKESDLRVKVDVHDINELSVDFKKLITKDLTPLQI